MPVPIEWDLTGKTAVITADRRGWTQHLASALAEAGATVVVSSRTLDRAKDAVAAIPATDAVEHQAIELDPQLAGAYFQSWGSLCRKRRLRAGHRRRGEFY